MAETEKKTTAKKTTKSTSKKSTTKAKEEKMTIKDIPSDLLEELTKQITQNIMSTLNVETKSDTIENNNISTNRFLRRIYPSRHRIFLNNGRSKLRGLQHCTYQCLEGIYNAYIHSSIVICIFTKRMVEFRNKAKRASIIRQKCKKLCKIFLIRSNRM